MDWMRVYMIETAELETRWMEIMESLNGNKKQGYITPSSPAANEAGQSNSATTEADSGGGYTPLDSQSK